MSYQDWNAISPAAAGSTTGTLMPLQSDSTIAVKLETGVLLIHVQSGAIQHAVFSKGKRNTPCICCFAVLHLHFLCFCMACACLVHLLTCCGSVVLHLTLTLPCMCHQRANEHCCTHCPQIAFTRGARCVNCLFCCVYTLHAYLEHGPAPSEQLTCNWRTVATPTEE